MKKLNSPLKELWLISVSYLAIVGGGALFLSRVAGLSEPYAINMAVGMGAGFVLMRGIVTRSVFLYPFVSLFTTYIGAYHALYGYLLLRHPEIIDPEFPATFLSLGFSMMLAIVTAIAATIFNYLDMKQTERYQQQIRGGSNHGDP